MAWGNDQLLCLKILHSRKTRYVYVKIGNERRDVLGDSRKRYHRPWTEIGKYWPRKEPIRLDLSFLYVSTTSVDTLLLIRLWQQSNSIHRSKASVLVKKLAQFKCFEHVVEKKTFKLQGKHHSISFARLLLLLSSDKILYFAQLYRSKLEQQ